MHKIGLSGPPTKHGSWQPAPPVDDDATAVVWPTVVLTVALVLLVAVVATLVLVEGEPVVVVGLPEVTGPPLDDAFPTDVEPTAPPEPPAPPTPSRLVPWAQLSANVVSVTKTDARAPPAILW